MIFFSISIGWQQGDSPENILSGSISQHLPVQTFIRKKQNRNIAFLLYSQQIRGLFEDTGYLNTLTLTVHDTFNSPQTLRSHSRTLASPSTSDLADTGSTLSAAPQCVLPSALLCQ